MMVTDLPESTEADPTTRQSGLDVRTGGWLLGIAAILAVLFSFLHFPSPPPEPSTELAIGIDLERSVPHTGQTVHVAGAVRAPGLVIVPDGARVADAIAAAGGASSVADLTSVNLAAPVVDGMQLLVPGFSDASSVQGGAGTTADGMIDINRAGIEELTALPGVGSVLAGRIVSYRDANGPFGAVEDLLDVSGIGEGKLAAIREVAVTR